MSDQHQTTRCTCLGGSTHGTDDAAVRRCDLCGGIVVTDRLTGEYVETMCSPALMALLREFYTEAEIAVWWHSPQPMFDGGLPPDLIAAGREADLVLALRRLAEGVYV